MLIRYNLWSYFKTYHFVLTIHLALTRMPGILAAFVESFNSFGMMEELNALSVDELAEPRCSFCQTKSNCLLGGGSNILFTKNLDGVVWKNELKGIELVNEDADHYYVKAHAGENWHQFVQHCVEHGYAGVENLSLIPGNVGASPMQNIGAYGVEIKDVFHQLEAYHMQ
jgi:UDP-N-acetylmuramate dehydrogenase